MTKEIELEGKTAEEAINKALEQLKVKRDEVEIKILSEGKAGLFGLMGAVPAKIKVFLKQKEGVVPHGDEYKALLLKIEETVKNILGKMNIENNIALSVEGENIRVKIETPDSALLIGKGGQTLDALQYLVNLMINRQMRAEPGVKSEEQEVKIRVILDTEDYRLRRENKLINLAKRIAQNVKETGKKEALELMSPQDRRTIHLALQDDKEVETISEGEGILRRIIIRKRTKE